MNFERFDKITFYLLVVFAVGFIWLWYLIYQASR